MIIKMSFTAKKVCPVFILQRQDYKCILVKTDQPVFPQRIGQFTQLKVPLSLRLKIEFSFFVQKYYF